MDSPRRFAINGPEVVHEIIDGEAVIINLSSGFYYSLDGAGADAWAALSSVASAEEIVDAVAERYAGERREIEAAVQGFLDQLQAEELIAPAESDAAVSAAPRSSKNADPGTEKPLLKPFLLQKYTDMNQLLLLDPVHDADETGWPARKRTISSPDHPDDEP